MTEADPITLTRGICDRVGMGFELMTEDLALDSMG